MNTGQEFVLALLATLVVVATSIAYLDEWLSRDVDEDIRREIRS